MKTNFVTARPDYSVDTVAEALIAMGTGAVAVVDEWQRPVGIVTLVEVMRDWHASGDAEEREPRTVRLRDLAREAMEPGFHSVRTTRSLVGEMMAPLVLTLPMNTCVVEAASVMAALEIQCLVIVDRRRRIVGLMTPFEVAGWVASRLGPSRSSHGLDCKLHRAATRRRAAARSSATLTDAAAGPP